MMRSPESISSRGAGRLERSLGILLLPVSIGLWVAIACAARAIAGALS